MLTWTEHQLNIVCFIKTILKILILVPNITNPYVLLLIYFSLIIAVKRKDMRPEVYLEPSRTSMIEFFPKIVKLEAVNYFRKKKHHRICSTGF